MKTVAKLPQIRAVLLLSWIASALLGFTSVANAQIDHQLIRRMAMFPMQAAKELEGPADEAWWQARDELTKSRRFLVASKQFLVKSDVFQPRSELEPADAIILGKLLDAHALVTMVLDGRRITTTVYDGGNGLILWKKSVSLHPSLTIADQLPQMARRIMNDFIASIPYQGFTVVDTLIGQPVYEEGDVKLANVDLGTTTNAQIGDVVQWIKITSTTSAPLFQGGSKSTIFAEGKIVRIDQGVAIVEILRATGLKNITEFTLVRIPREAERMVGEFTISETPRTTLTAELVAPEASPMEEIARERRPLLTALSFIGSMAAFLLLAF